jgi:hypothetical protein
MARRSTPPELRLQVSFKVSRIAPQCLAEAYERLVPIPRRSTRPIITAATSTTPAAALPMRRRADHG